MVSPIEAIPVCALLRYYERGESGVFRTKDLFSFLPQGTAQPPNFLDAHQENKTYLGDFAPLIVNTQ